MRNMNMFMRSIGFLLFLSANPIASPVNADESFFRTGPSGGMGGQRFNDDPNTGPVVKEVRVSSGAFIDSIQVVYGDQKDRLIAGRKHGGPGGNLSVLKLAPGEYITTVGGKYGRFIDSLYIKTNKGQTKRWGGPGGDIHFIYDVPPGAGINGFFGHAGKYIDSIGVIMKTMHRRDPEIARPFPLKDINAITTKDDNNLKAALIRKSINAAGHVVVSYPDGRTVEKYAGGQTVTLPNGQSQKWSYFTQAPAAMPPALPDNEEAKWLEGHSRGLMQIIETMVGNDPEAIRHYRQHEEQRSSVYEQINERTATIDYLATP